VDSSLFLLPVLWFSCTGFYYIVAAITLEQVVTFGNYGSFEIKQLENRKDRLSTFFSGMISIVISIILGELNTGGKLLKVLSVYF
jgi:hypothetical protein